MWNSTEGQGRNWQQAWNASGQTGAPPTQPGFPSFPWGANSTPGQVQPAQPHAQPWWLAKASPTPNPWGMVQNLYSGQGTDLGQRFASAMGIPANGFPWPGPNSRPVQAPVSDPRWAGNLNVSSFHNYNPMQTSEAQTMAQNWDRTKWDGGIPQPARPQPTITNQYYTHPNG